ncbi:GntR family transcriptional regulator [Ostreiculturibacter nitratireducens]|uniref:GntR family transcriptional regulator n=1 Tax=Ostreiculturibacter nitratireducens TaxID=3075226 RepID=UPI0031B5C301
MRGLAFSRFSLQGVLVLEQKKPIDATIPARPAPRETLQDYVYLQVKDLIMNGEIEPGRTITIQSLAAAFSVSHMPVREALHRLTAERALAVVGGRSVGIPALSLERLEDLRRVRSEVEGLAAAWAAERIDAATLDRLEELHHALDDAVADGDVKRYLRANRELHFGVYDAAGSPTLRALIEPLWLQISPYFNHLRGSGNYAKSNTCHRALIDALRARNPEEARRAVQADIAAASEILKSMIGK